MNQALRVATRWVQSTYFGLNSIVLYGKYKNHHGKIVSFGQDKWGNPTIEIEPIPRGRKKNKIMGLFKVWRADVKEKALAEQAAQQGNLVMSVNKRVVARYVQARGIEMGRTVVVGDLRIHRYSDHFRITDLVNAGKRGKKVREMTLGPSYRYSGDKEQWLDNMSHYLLDYRDYDRALGLIKDLMADFPGEINLEESEVKGIDVTPADATAISLKTNTGLQVSATPLDWSLKSTVTFTGKGEDNKDKSFNQDTLYWPARKRLDTLPFYNWLVANLSEANRTDLDGYKKLWDSLGVRYDSH